MLKKIILVAIIIAVSNFSIFAQITTSSIVGSVKSSTEENLVGATITATHLPSGTVYTTLAKRDGSFNLPGLRVGGPYQVKIDFVGQKSQVYDNVTLQLGQDFSINAIMGSDEKVLTDVVVTTSTRKTRSDKGGISTVVDNRLLTTLPTISRSLTDFTRLTPQSFGNSFGGRDGKLNNITVDGANLNNNFGLSTDPLPGGGSSPVSLDALEEVSVSIAPFDVRQGNFTGGTIAAITKSGTNTFHGTLYAYAQNQNFIGYKVGNERAAKSDFVSGIKGGSVSGPIIKNKLFFFINYENENKPPSGGVTWTPKGGSGTGNISDVPVDSLKKVSDYLNSKFGFDPGVYDNFPNFLNENRKYLIKLDWNINKSHKLTAKYSDFLSEQDNGPSSSGNVGGTYSGAVYGAKFSKSAMGFNNINYVQKDIVQSGSIELNSNFKGKFSNQLLGTYTHTFVDKTHNGDKFPFVDILGATTGDTRNFISLGNEAFNGNANKVLNNITTITDNFTYYAGKHTLSLGVSYEFQEVGNMFMRGSQGYYVFKNVDDFVNNRAPLKFGITYSYDKGVDEVYSANLKIGQLATYIQDDINLTSNFKLTLGLRVDKPIYPQQPRENTFNSALTFQDINGKPAKYSTGIWPKASALFSPRAGFRWNLYGDNSLIIRGGTGIFTGRIPFVYLTNIPTNSGMYQNSAGIQQGQAGIDMNNYLFNPDPHAYNPAFNSALPAQFFPLTAGAAASTDFVVTAPNFKFPQVWRTTLGLDKTLGKGWKFSTDIMITKDINATYMYNANQKTPDATVVTGGFTRARFSSSSAAVRRINAGITNAIVLDNIKKGGSFVYTAQIAKSFTKGFYASFAYNYTFVQDVTANPGSQASSVWNNNPTGGTLNDFELAYSGYGVPHRIVGSFSYRKEYLKHLATTISLFYEGSKGSAYSYIYNGDLNNDGFSQDLMYVPKDANDPNEIQFKNNVVIGGVTYTSAQQAAIFQDFINQDPYLRKHKGQITERNGARIPWRDRLDAKLVQDIFAKVGKNKHTIQVTADFYNVLNLINKDWGLQQRFTVNNPLKLESVTGTAPLFSITPFNNAPVNTTYNNNVSTSGTWAMQLGFRYIF